VFDYKRLFFLISIGLTVPAFAATILQPRQQYKLRVEVPITFSAFIPDNYIDAPAAIFDFLLHPYCALNPCVYEGDDRPFSATATTYRVRQSITLIPADPTELLGFRVGTTSNLASPSALYDKATSLGPDDRLTSAARADTILNDHVMKLDFGTANTSSMHVVTTRTAPRGMRADLSGDVTNPLPLIACDITWNLSVTVDATSKASPIITITGNRGRYPAYDISVGVQYLQIYDPRPLERTVLSLCLPTESESRSEALQ